MIRIYANVNVDNSIKELLIGEKVLPEKPYTHFFMTDNVDVYNPGVTLEDLERWQAETDFLKIG